MERSAGGTLENTSVERAVASANAKAAAGGAFLALSQISGLLLGLLLMGYLTRQLGSRQYGVYALSMLLMNWFSTLISAVCGPATVRLVAGRDDGHRYAVTMLHLMGGLGLVAGGFLALTAPVLGALLGSADLPPLLRILAWALPIQAVAGVYRGIVNARGQFGTSAILTPIAWALQLAGAFVFIESGYAARGAVMPVLGVGLFEVVVGRLLTKIPIFNRDGVKLRNLWRQSRLTVGMHLIMRIGLNMDLVALKYFGGSLGIAGHYAGAQNIMTSAIVTFSGPINTTILQTLSQSYRDADWTAARRTGLIFLRLSLVYGGILMAHAVLANDIVRLLLGGGFAGAGSILAILLGVAAFRVIAFSSRTLITAAGESAKILPSLLAVLVAGCIAFALTIPQGGAIAAAAVSLTISGALAYFSVREALTLTGISFPWVTLVRVALAGSCTALVSTLMPGTGLWVILKLTVATFTYGVLLLALGEFRLSLRHAENFKSGLLHFIGGKGTP